MYQGQEKFILEGRGDLWAQVENERSKTVPTISRIIQQFKGSISKHAGLSLWQKSFYDRIIRNEQEYQEIWQYVEMNPLKWEEDEYFT